MSVALIIIGDGRDDYHEQSVASAKAMLPMSLIDERIIVDDRDHQLGYAGAIQHAWDQVNTEWVFHLEADFVFHRPVELGAMIAVLEAHRELAQLVLKRQPVNAAEIAAGGIVEQHPYDFTERQAFGVWPYTEHRRFWSTNPCLYPRRIVRVGWPQEPESEGRFGRRLLADPHLRFAFWGAKHADPMVEHIGHQRAGTGY